MDKITGIFGSVKNFVTQNNVFKYIVTHYVICIALAFVFFKWNEKQHTQETDSLKKEIIAKDVLVEEAKGQYRKVVDYYNTEKSLASILASRNKDLLKTVNDQHERLLMLTNTDLTFKPNTNNTASPLIPVTNYPDSVKFNAYYPQEKDFLVRHYGTISTKNNQMYNNWEFGKLNLDIVVTETANGIWNTRIAGPDYLVVSNLKVNSLPAKDLIPKSDRPKNLSWLLGGGVNYNLNDKKYDVKVGGGLEIKNKIIVLGEISGKSTVGVGIYKRF